MKVILEAIELKTTETPGIFRFTIKGNPTHRVLSVKSSYSGDGWIAFEDDHVLDDAAVLREFVAVTQGVEHHGLRGKRYEYKGMIDGQAYFLFIYEEVNY